MPYPFQDTTNDYTPINDLKTVTPNDSTDLPLGVSRGVVFTTTGTINFDTAAGTTVSMPIGSTLLGTVVYIRLKRVRATGTTTTGILAAY